MRILHVLDHSIPTHTGYTFRTLSILRAQHRLGWQTSHVTSPKHGDGPALEETVEGLRFDRTPGGQPHSPVPGIREWRLMQRLETRIEAVARRDRPDLIHAHSPVLNAFPSLRVGARLGIPVVYEVRAFWEDAAVDHGTTTEGSLRYRITRALETRAFRRAAHVFTICEGLRSDIVARGIPASKVTVIPNAVDIEAFQAGKEADAALAEQLGIAGCTVVGFIGSFYAYEGLDLLLSAWPGLLARRTDLRLLLVGGGPQEAALREQARALGVQDRVIFTGRVPHADVQRYYDLVDVLAYPRHRMRLTDLVTPLKPLEAMAQQRLLLASDVGGHRELIRHGETGWMFEAGSVESLTARLLELLEAHGQWDALRAAGRRFVETERNWKASVGNYVRPYARLTEQVGP